MSFFVMQCSIPFICVIICLSLFLVRCVSSLRDLATLSGDAYADAWRIADRGCGSRLGSARGRER